MQLIVHPLKLVLANPFTIAHGTYHHREAIVIELVEDGLSGFGEATVISYYGKELATFIATLEQIKPTLENLSFTNPPEFYQHLLTLLKDHPFLRCALDVAAHDLWAKRLGLPLYQALGLSIEKLPISNFTIGIDELPKMVEQIETIDLPIYKIKLGTNQDIEIIKALREQTTAIFRVDANEAWSAAETISKAKFFKELGVELIEQPLPRDDWKGMKKVFKKSVLPIIADESCQELADVQKCHQHFQGINIKLMKCGGITPALQMIQKARKLDMKVMLGCMTESSIGISAIAHLAPLLDYVDMDGALLLKEDPAVGAYLKEGKIYYGSGNGLGAVLK